MLIEVDARAGYPGRGGAGGRGGNGGHGGDGVRFEWFSCVNSNDYRSFEQIEIKLMFIGSWRTWWQRWSRWSFSF